MTTAVLAHPALDFDPESHIYTRRSDGVAVPHWHQIAEAEGIFDPRWIPGWALDRGTTVHLACEAWENGTLGEYEWEPWVDDYLGGFRTWYADSRPELIASERIVCHTVENYACRLDRIYRLGEFDIPCIVEIKTGKHNRSYALQTAAQMLAAMHEGLVTACDRAALCLPGDGTYKFHPHESAGDEDVALGSVRLFHWKRRTQK